MSKYTTELRFICERESGLGNSVGGKKVSEVIANALPKIFDFDFPIFDEAYRGVLEKKILMHFYTREIGLETYGLWKLKLETVLNEIMPYYNQLYKSQLLTFNPLYTTNLNRTRKTILDSNRSENGSENGNGSLNDTSSANSNGTNWDLYLDTPQNGIADLSEEHYLTNARKVTDSNVSSGTLGRTTTNSSTRSLTDNLDSVEDYLENVVGFEGKDASSLLLKYRETFLNIDMQVIKELEDLFMQLW